jgi:hypothetical protein
MGDAGRAWSIVKDTNGIELFGQTVTENAISSHPCAEVFLRGEKFPLCGVAFPVSEDKIVTKVQWIEGPRNKMIDVNLFGHDPTAIKAKVSLQVPERVL